MFFSMEIYKWLVESHQKIGNGRCVASCCSLDDKAMNLGSLKLARKGAQPTDAVANLLDIAGIIRRSGERFRALARK